MYLWPEGLDCRIFEDRKIIALTFTENTLCILFENDDQITVLGSWSLMEEGQDKRVYSIPAQDSVPIHTIIGETVVESNVIDGADLVLVFDSFAITIAGSDRDYECYTILANGREYIV